MCIGFFNSLNDSSTTSGVFSDETLGDSSNIQTSQNGQISLTQTTESPILQITTQRLNRQNFLRWSQYVKLFIRGRGKIDYLNGTKQAPKFDDPTYHVWDVENSMILSWLLKSMEPEIDQTNMYLSTTKQLWDAMNETYSYLANSLQVYELKTKIGNTTKGNLFVTSYYNMLKSLWQELDLFYDLEWSCAEDSAQYQRIVEKECVNCECLARLAIPDKIPKCPLTRLSNSFSD